ncbi:MAG TPA: polysaccharide biosynthesis tyrosine autokinase [Anaerolineae bacterium]|nr:polysaccharide biosynthesis tyrosine autokinase [Anaerolineae bacterium]
MNDFADLRVYTAIVLRQWWLLVLAAVAGAAIGFAVSQGQPRIYQAATTLIVGQSIQATQLDSRDLLTSEQLAQTYAEIARRQPVLQSVVDALGLNVTWTALKGRVKIKLIEGTQLLEIRAEANVPEEAARIADEVARQLILLSPTANVQNQEDENQNFVRQQLDSLQTKIEGGQAKLLELEAMLADALLTNRPAVTPTLQTDPVQSLQVEISALERLLADWQANYAQLLTFTEAKTSSNFLSVIEPAQLDGSATRPNVRLNSALAGVIGFILVFGVIVVRVYLSDVFMSSDDLSQFLDLAYLGAVSRIRGRHYQHKLITWREPFAPASEAYRIIRSNIQFMSAVQPSKSIMITSPTPGEGKSITAANLAVVIAQAGFKTIIVDADLRRPVQHRIFAVPNREGLSDLLCAPGPELNGHLQSTGIENLSVITSGTPPTTNPSELLSSQYMGRLASRLNQIADVIIFDVPPTLVVADAAVLSIQVDSVVMVIEAGRTRRDVARQAMSNLRQAGARLLGGVLNGVLDTRRTGYYSGARAIKAKSPQ